MEKGEKTYCVPVSKREADQCSPKDSPILVVLVAVSKLV